MRKNREGGFHDKNRVTVRYIDTAYMDKTDKIPCEFWVFVYLQQCQQAS
jgi:hypothetical protein